MENQIRNNKRNTHMLRKERKRVGRGSREVGGRERRDDIYTHTHTHTVPNIFDLAETKC